MANAWNTLHYFKEIKTQGIFAYAKEMVIKTCVKGIGFAEEAFTYTGIRIIAATVSLFLDQYIDVEFIGYTACVLAWIILKYIMKT